MNLNDRGIIDLADGYDGPMCPRSFPPVVDRAHELAERFRNVVYEATPRDVDNEPLTADLAAVNDAVSYGRMTNNRMHLFRDAVVAKTRDGHGAVVEALYFRCRICGFVLPAGRAA